MCTLLAETNKQAKQNGNVALAEPCGDIAMKTFHINMRNSRESNIECLFKPILTVRRCFLRMYMMKPHILDVTLRKVRMPSKHCRVFSMLMSTQGTNSTTRQLKLSVKSAPRRPTLLSNLWRRWPASDRKTPVCSTAAKLAIRNPTRGPGKRVSTSLCTLAAQIRSNMIRFHCN